GSSIVAVRRSTRAYGRPSRVTLAIREAAGRRSRNESERSGSRDGTSIDASISPASDRSENEIGPKLVGTARTSIRFPAASQARGVAYASRSPLGTPCRSGVSWTSVWRSVSRKLALLAPLGGRYIER